MTKIPELPQIDAKKVGSLYSKTDLLKALSEYLNDAIPRIGYQEDHFWTNIRIILCMVCCSFGVFAQFGTKFPKDRTILAGCVAGYFLFSGILALMDYFIIKQSVLCIKIGNVTVFADVHMQSFSHEVTITLRSRGKTVSHKTSVGHYFDTDGYLRQQHIFTDFLQLVQKFESKEAKKDK